MGKHFWRRHIDDEQEHKQPGCVWGFVQALGQSNVRKMIHYRTYEDEEDFKCDRSPKTKYDSCDEEENLLDEKQTSHSSTKGSRKTKKRSLKKRIKALIADEISGENEKIKQHKKGSSIKSSLQRTYSIHHLESLDGSLRKICTDWKNPIFFFPGKIGNSEDTAQKTEANTLSENSNMVKPELFKEEPDVLEIFKVDKELFIKQIQEADENSVNFSRRCSNNPILSKSRSFPASQRRIQLKPTKLESKQKEIWSFPKEVKFRIVDRTPSNEDTSDPKEESTTERDFKRSHSTNKRIHRRSSSLNDSMDKYARLFDATDAKLHVSKSLKLTNENGHAPMYFSRIRSLSNVDSFYSDLNFGIAAQDSSSGLEEQKIVVLTVDDRENVSIETGKDQTDVVDMENYDRLRLNEENVEVLKEDKFEKSDSCRDQETDVAENSENDIASHLEDPHLNEGLERGCGDFDDSLIDSNQDRKSLDSKPLSTHLTTRNLDIDEKSNKVLKFSDLYYVRPLLNESGIAEDALERTWHASDQPLSQELFGEVEAGWPHERDQLTGWPDFYGCWHHQMLFNLVNEVLVELYDLALPYYPKALSSSCQVRPFPLGKNIIEEVNNSIRNLTNLKPEERESLDGIVGYDFANDRRWMNLQMESECTGLDLEEMIFDELLEEIMCS